MRKTANSKKKTEKIKPKKMNKVDKQQEKKQEKTDEKEKLLIDVPSTMKQQSTTTKQQSTTTMTTMKQQQQQQSTTTTTMKQPIFTFANGRAFVDVQPVGNDSCYIETFYQQMFPANTDVSPMFDQLCDEMPWTDPENGVMRYRGHALKRQKAFLVDRDDPLRIYTYPGFQYESTKFYRRIGEIPVVADLVATLERRTRYNGDEQQYNHVIATYYCDGESNIGFHSDRARDIAPETPILMMSFGGRRELHLRDAATKDVEQVFVMQPGSLFVLGPRDNHDYQHSIVPQCDERVIDRRSEPLEPRISLVLRNIATTMQRADLDDKIEKSRALKKKNQEKRKLASARQGEATSDDGEQEVEQEAEEEEQQEEQEVDDDEQEAEAANISTTKKRKIN